MPTRTGWRVRTIIPARWWLLKSNPATSAPQISKENTGTETKVHFCQLYDQLCFKDSEPKVSSALIDVFGMNIQVRFKDMGYIESVRNQMPRVTSFIIIENTLWTQPSFDQMGLYLLSYDSSKLAIAESLRRIIAKWLEESQMRWWVPWLIMFFGSLVLLQLRRENLNPWIKHIYTYLLETSPKCVNLH